MRKVKVAVVGAGIFGGIHVRTYSEEPRCELITVCDIDEKRAKAIAKKYSCSWTTDTMDVASNPEIQAVSIATPDFAHTKIALEMISAGKHVLIEKPLATTVKEARQIVDAARKSHVKLMVDFQNRWNAPFIEAKKEIESGNFGEPLMSYARLSNPICVPLKMLSWARKSGPHWFLFPHIIDLVRWLIGQDAVEVYAKGTKGILKKRGIDTYDTIQAIVKFKTCHVTFETSWVLPDAWPSYIDFELTLYGGKSRIEVRADKQCITVTDTKHRWPFVLGIGDAHGRDSGFMRLPMIHFIDCIIQDKEPLSTGEDGLAITAIIEAILKSIATNRVVKVER